MDLQRSLKYGLDRISGWVLVVLLAPLMAAIAATLRLERAGSPLALEERAGAGARPFTLFAFATRSVDVPGSPASDSAGEAAAGAGRVGSWLERSRLAVLPQLLNIALGEMSFVGPRAVSRAEAERWTPRERRRLLFRPGLTGWARVEGGPRMSPEREIELDLYYVDHFCLGLDLRILRRALVGSPPARPTAPAPAPTATPVATAAPVPAPAGTSVPASVPRAAPAPTAFPETAPAGLLPLLVVGAGGHARVVVDVAEKQGRYRVVGLVDDRPALAGTSFMGYPVLGGREVLQRPDAPAHAFVAIGAPRSREAWQQHLEELGFQVATLVHPSAQVGREVALGCGTVLMAGAIVNSGSRLGRGVIVNTAASIDHDCAVGDFAHVAPGARLAGGAVVGTRAHVGIASCILQGLAVGDDAVVGGGAAVVKSVPPGVTVVGVPARPLVMREAEPATAVPRRG